MAAVRPTKDYYEYSYALAPYWRASKEDKHGWEANYHTRHGIVEVEVREPAGHNEKGSSHLTFLHNGRDYHRGWRKKWPLRTMARLANNFADDVVHGRVTT